MNDEKLSKLYNEIAEVVIDTIPEKWFKVYLYGEVGEGAQESYFITTPEENSTPIYSHSILNSLMSQKKNILRSGIIC